MKKNTFLIISTRSRAWKGVSGGKKKRKLFLIVEERIVTGDKDFKFFMIERRDLLGEEMIAMYFCSNF